MHNLRSAFYYLLAYCFINLLGIATVSAPLPPSDSLPMRHRSILDAFERRDYSQADRNLRELKKAEPEVFLINNYEKVTRVLPGISCPCSKNFAACRKGPACMFLRYILNYDEGRIITEVGTYVYAKNIFSFLGGIFIIESPVSFPRSGPGACCDVHGEQHG